MIMYRMLLFIGGLCMLSCKDFHKPMPDVNMKSTMDSLRETDSAKRVALGMPAKPKFQKDAPIKILSASIVKSDYSTYAEIKFKNISDKDIDAIKFELVVFNAFNESLEKVRAIYDDPITKGQTRTGSWIVHISTAKKIGLAKVEEVMFKDGTKW